MAYKLKYLKKSLILIFIIIIITLSSCAKGDEKNFTFASYKTAESVKYKVHFNDDYFKNPASEYNPSLASASACLALAGFSSATSLNYSKADSNAKNFFNTLGFENYLSNPDGTSKPTAESFGVFIATKKIDDYTLIGVTVRGAGYLSEWASNFTIGKNEDFAQGFYDASNIYLHFLKEYINTYNITGKIKIWTSGYSRGGAVVNLSSGRIDDGLLENKNILSDKVTYTKDDIYAYCFEAPAGRITHSTDEIFEKGENYSNIYNVLNLNDPVPFVAPRAFNFVRYGNDLFLPDIITDINYQNQINIVKKKLKKLPNYKNVGDYKLDGFKDESIISFMNSESLYKNMTPYLFLNNFIDLLCEILESKDTYVEKYQDLITEIFKMIYKSYSPKESIINIGINFGKSFLLSDPNEITLFDLQYNRSQFIKDIQPILYNTFKKLDINITFNDVTNLVKNTSLLIAKILFAEEGFQTIKPIINLENLKIIGSAHIPELLLTHITSLDPKYENSNLEIKSSFNIMYITTTDEFELTIDNNKYIYFENGEINSKLSLKKINDGYAVYLPTDANYKLSTKGKLSYELYNHNNKYLSDKLIKSENL